MNGETFWQGLGKIGAMTMLVTFFAVLFAQPSLAADQLIFHNSDTGKVMFWILNSDGKLKNKDMSPAPGAGWGLVSDWGPAKGWTIAATRERKVGGMADKQLIWHNTDTGKLMYWNIGDTGQLANLEQGKGWDLVSDWALNTNWNVVGLGGPVPEDGKRKECTYLQFWNQENRKACYWVLDSNGHLLSEEQGPVAAGEEDEFGWDVNSNYTAIDEDGEEEEKSWELPSGWYLARVHQNGNPAALNGGSTAGNRLIWHNTVSGKLMYWNLNSNNTLKNRIQFSFDDDGKPNEAGTNHGWGFLDNTKDNEQDMSAWRVVGLNAPVCNTVLQFFNPKKRDAKFWSLNTNNTLACGPKGKGIVYNHDQNDANRWMPAKGWYIAQLREKAKNKDGEIFNQLIWQNSDTGRLMYWNLSEFTNTITKKKPVKNTDWGLTGEYKKDEEWIPNKAWQVRGLLQD